MGVIINSNHIQSDTLYEYDSFFDIKKVDTFEEGLLSIQDEPTVLAGFIYDDITFNKVINSNSNIDNNIKNNDIYYVSDIGLLPDTFITVDSNKKYYSLLQQIVELSKDPFPEWVETDAKDLTRYYNFQDFEDVFDLNSFYKKEVDMVREKCYNNGNVYLLYEVLPDYKLPLAYSLLSNKEHGIVIIGSQTRSNNDILTFYVKGMDAKAIASMFNVEHDYDSNIFHTFVNSHINILGNQITKFIREKGSSYE
ncbi:hypothetical protein StAP1_155 [Staphylococcus phage vB_SauH_SAP1]|uniref:Uncharacterized protein n=1 Tax=Staphylococcus phage vB_SauH_SAP1 TaxID=2759206 RepID=A0A7G7WVP3_9CAUD|nr:hypothetical protein StAP1_155 [Staphylococcus phage vB_SauH_SAP1]